MKLREIEEAKKRQAADKAHLVARATYSATYIDPFESFQRTRQKWEGHKQRRLSEKQRMRLVRAGIDPDRLTLTEALAAHWDLIRASDKQRAVLARYYPREEVERMTRWQAVEVLNALAKNGWRKPS